jgi:sialidase-1
MKILPLLLLAALLPAAEPSHPLLPGATIIPLLPPGPGNPRNTEGAFITLKDGRILFAYSRFTGGGGDHAAAYIAGRYSSDGGRTWTADDVTIVEREGQMNVMSVSLLRLKDRRIALFYLRKNSTSDCRPYLRYSSDEARTWTEPILCIKENGYYVLNNDRAVQLRRGRIVLPVSQHAGDGMEYGSRGIAMAYLSDDAGRTWRVSRTRLECPDPSPAGFQEPGVIELKDGRLMMFIRTRLGCQYLSYSSDGGDTWSPAVASNIRSPLSPASIKRIPKKKDLLMIWNDNGNEGPTAGRRTPLTVAISRDEGKTWIRPHNLRDDPKGWYCYTAIHFAGSRVLVGFNDGGAGLKNLSRTSIAWFDVKRLYK